MAAGSIPSPRSPYGPCADGCTHEDCCAGRQIAGSACRICGQPIGYDTDFYRDGLALYVHAACLEEEIEQQQKERA